MDWGWGEWWGGGIIRVQVITTTTAATTATTIAIQMAGITARSGIKPNAYSLADDSLIYNISSKHLFCVQ